MANGTEGKNRHFILEGVTETEAYRSPLRGGSRSIVPERDRSRHGGGLLRRIDELRAEANAARDIQREAGLEEGLGLQVAFESFSGIELAFESLARERQGIELLNVRREDGGDGRTRAAVFVPDGKLDHFEKLVRCYLERKRDSAGRARDNRRLIDAIQDIRAVRLRDLWTDDPEEFPVEDKEPFWWEVWLPRGKSGCAAAFRKRVEAQGMQAARIAVKVINQLGDEVMKVFRA